MNVNGRPVAAVARASVEALVRQLLAAVGEDVEREGLVETPHRVASAYEKLLEGYGRDLADELTTFENTYGYDNVVLSGRIHFYSLCEHHLLPFWGHATVGYVPGARIAGLSKLARAVDVYARRLQEQERLTVQVADALMDALEPRGVAVTMTARHLCNVARGVEKTESTMATLVYRGEFEDDRSLQARFLELARVDA